MLLEQLRAQNIRRNEELFRSLGLDKPLIPKRPLRRTPFKLPFKARRLLDSNACSGVRRIPELHPCSLCCASAWQRTRR